MAFGAEELVGLARVSGVAAAPCGTWAVAAAARLDAKERSKYISDLWRIDLAGARPPVRLTRAEWSDHSPAFGPDGALYFLSNRPTLAADDDGHERRQQVFRLDPTGGEPVCVTREPLGVTSFKIAGQAGAEVLAVLAERLLDVEEQDQRKRAAEQAKNGPTGLRYRAMPARFWDHWLPQTATHALIYRGEQVFDLTPQAGRMDYHSASFALSEDGARLVLTHATYAVAGDRLVDGALDVLDTVTGARERFVAGPRADYDALVIAPDGHHVAAVRHQREDGACGKRQLVLVSLDEGDWRAVGEEVDLWLMPRAFAPDGQTLIVTADAQAEQPIFVVELGTGALSRVTAPGGAYDVAGWAGERLIGLRSALTAPPNVFTCAVEEGATPALHVLPGAETPAAAADVIVESIQAPTTDGGYCQAFVIKPAQHEGPLPVVFWIHGGPIGAWSDAWQWRWSPLTGPSQGYMLVLPNPRGSTGFGQAWVEGIWGNVWGAQCFEDVIAVADTIAARPDVQGDNMALMGGSFGGYMTAWVGTQTGARFRCLIDHAGVTSFGTFHGTTDLPAYWQHMLGLSPWRERTIMERYSPLRHIEGWRAPTLIIHGGRDYRVDPGEALTLFEALQAHGVESELLVFPDENHWILRPKNIIAWYDAVYEFLGRYLGR